MANRLGSTRQQGLLPMPGGRHRRSVRLLAPPIIEPERPEIFERCLAALAELAPAVTVTGVRLSCGCVQRRAG